MPECFPVLRGTALPPLSGLYSEALINREECLPQPKVQEFNIYKAFKILSRLFRQAFCGILTCTHPKPIFNEY